MIPIPAYEFELIRRSILSVKAECTELMVYDFACGYLRYYATLFLEGAKRETV